jgi:hypothetical protein
MFAEKDLSFFIIHVIDCMDDTLQVIWHTSEKKG